MRGREEGEEEPPGRSWVMGGSRRRILAVPAAKSEGKEIGQGSSSGPWDTTPACRIVSFQCHQCFFLNSQLVVAEEEQQEKGEVFLERGRG